MSPSRCAFRSRGVGLLRGVVISRWDPPGSLRATGIGVPGAVPCRIATPACRTYYAYARARQPPRPGAE